MREVDPPAAPLISVIMPVHNGGAYLARTIPAIRASTLRDFELLIVDDASTDATGDLLRRHPPDVLIENTHQLGPFASRNAAAQRARGRILFFTDADVLLQTDTLAAVARHLEQAGSDAVIGLYSAPDRSDNLWTFFKTAWIRFSYLGATEQATWFFTAVGALRREAWERCGPFRDDFSIKTGGGDIDYGRRLLACGLTIRLDKMLEVRHLKRFSLLSLLHNDLFRSFGYCRLALRGMRGAGASTAAPSRGIANVGSSFVAGVVAASVVLALAIRGAPLGLMLASIGLWLGVNGGFLSHVTRTASLSKAAAIAAVLWLDQVVCAVGVAGAVGQEMIRQLTAARARRP